MTSTDPACIRVQRKTFKTRNDSIAFPIPLPNARLPSLLLAVESVELYGTPLEGLQAFPLLLKMKNLRHLDIGGSKSHDPCSLLTALVDEDDPDWNEPPEDPFDDWATAKEEELDRRDDRRQARYERRYVRRGRPADYEDTTSEDSEDDEEDDDDNYSGNPYAPEKVKPETLKAVQEARQALPTVVGRLESITLGASSSESDFLAIVKLLEDARVKKLSFGLPSTAEHRKLRRQLHSIEWPSFLSAVNKLVGLEELVIGVAVDLHLRLAKKKWRFAPTLRSLELHIATLTPNTIALISQFTSLSLLTLSFDELKPRPTSSLALPNLPSRPRLAHLSLTFRLPRSISTFDPTQILSAFVAQPNLRIITLDLVPQVLTHSRPAQDLIILPIFRKFLLPLSSSNLFHFPSLSSLFVTKPTCAVLSPKVLACPPHDLLRSSIKVTFLGLPLRPDFPMSFDQTQIAVSAVRTVASDAAARQAALVVVESASRWVMEKIEELRRPERNRDGIGATREATELMEGLKGIYALRQLEAD